jgi:hypothetical protein
MHSPFMSLHTGWRVRTAGAVNKGKADQVRSLPGRQWASITEMNRLERSGR